MNKIFVATWLAVAASLAAPVSIAAGYTSYVNPFIGTGSMEGGLSGNCYPGATSPFGMVQLCPDTHNNPDWYNASGYHYNDSTIYGFSHTRLSGTGACDLIDITLFPTIGDKTETAFSHSDETASPGYYKVLMQDEGITAELTTTPRVGIHRYTFPASAAEQHLWIDVDHSSTKGSWGRQIVNAQVRQTAANAVEGYRVITGWAKLRKIYFHMEFDRPVEVVSLHDGNRTITDGTTVINGTAPKMLLRFKGDGNHVVCKVGLSGVSVANARENMATEAPGFDFDRYVAEADAEWEKALGRIEVEGDRGQMTTFYTALYHTMIQPNLFSDVNGEFMLPDYSTAKAEAGHNRYTTFSLWDTYRAAHPLYTMLFPELTRDFVNSMIDHYESYGYLPIWSLWGNDNYCMIGNHAIPVVVDAVLKGIPGIDSGRAWRAVEGSSTMSHPNSPFDLWEGLGYMPEDVQTQSVSISLEMSYDDACVARLAARLGKTGEQARFEARSRNYANLFNPATGFFQPKNAAGEWMEPFDPLKHGGNGGAAFTEGNAWQYYWYVPHDISHLVALTGGKKAFEKKLDTFFTLDEKSGDQNNNVSGLIGQYAHGNEPSHHVAFLYNHVGKPEKTQALIRHIMATLYDNTPAGYSGNDDCGEMSAWYVFNALGFYPVDPASGRYDLGTPLFDRAVIHLPSGKDFTITASRRSADDFRVKSVKLNGAKYHDIAVGHSDIINGGSMEFSIGR